MICHVSLVCCILLCFFGLERLQAYRFEELSHGVFQKKFDSLPGEKVFHSVLQETPNPKNLELYDRVGKPSSDDLHEGVFFVKQQNIDVLTERLYEVSNPVSPTYGDYLSLEEVKEMSINKNSINHIIKVLQGYGFSEITTTVTGDFIIVEDKISLWESLLNCEFHVFRHKEIPNFDVIRTLEFSLPIELVNHVETVFNTVHFPLHKLPIASASPELQTEINKLGDVNPQVGRRVHGYVTPDLLFSFYHINPIGNSLASQGVYETIGQTYSPKDLELFQRKFNLTVSDIAVDIGGHKNDQTCIDSPDDCGEANLDVQYLMAVAQKVPTTYYYWSGQDFMVQWMVQVSQMSKPPQVFSISYGADEDRLPTSYGAAFNTIAIKLGLRGITITVSSGDDGALSSSARKNPLGCAYHPSFPATSPYVTAVGGTMGPEKENPEVACQGDNHGIITTGGGFSIMYGMPDWQQGAVESYFQLVQGTDKDPFKGFNRQGRGYPDISLLAHNYVITLGGNFTAVSGTSASSPVFAGYISLVNSKRLKNNLPALGWINPALYLYGSSFVNDITEGSNNCVALGTVCCSQGFYATEGWDPVTGLGSVNYDTFEHIMMTLPSPSFAPTTRPRSPTFKPTAKIPTKKPTPAPTISSGFLFIQEYEQESCEGKITNVNGIPTNVCMVEYDSSLTESGSRLFSCTEDYVEVSYYTSSDCSARYLSGQNKYYLGCALKVEDYYYAERAYSLALVCGEGSDDLPLGDSNFIGNYAIERSYDSTTGCEDESISSINAFLEDYCINSAQDEASFKIEIPTVYFYKGLGCEESKFDSTMDLNMDCESAMDNSDGGNRNSVSTQYDYSYSYNYESGSVELYSQWAEVTADGTHDSSEFPTNTPTVTPSIRVVPSKLPSLVPSRRTTGVPTGSPSISFAPTGKNSTDFPTVSPTPEPSAAPTANPSSRKPSVRPSFAATKVPTREPTSTPAPTTQTSKVAQPVHVLLAQVLQGISLSTWQEQPAECFKVFTASLSKILEQFPGIKVILEKVSEVGVSPIGRQQIHAEVVGINITYRVIFDLSDTSIGSSSAAGRLLATSVTDSASSGKFSTYLTYFASIYQVPEMFGVVTDTVIIVSNDYKPPSPKGTDSSSSNHHVNVVGVTIAVIIGMIIIALSIYWCTSKGKTPTDKKATSYAVVSLEGDSVHNPVQNINQQLDDEIEIELTPTVAHESV